MGAILAIIGEPGDPEIPVRLERMLARSPYRGSPQRHIENGIAIAVQSRGWDASLATIGNWTVAMHGVIGNWAELAPAYGLSFPNGAPNAAKVAIAFEELGDSLFGVLRGEFAILVVDRKEHTIITVRDLWAKRPLFIEHTQGRTYIASEIRQLRAGSKIPNRIDGDVLIQAVLWSPAYQTRTHVKGIRRIRPGRINLHLSRLPQEPVNRGEIWTPPPDSGHRGRYEFEALTEEFRFLVEQAVDRWLIGVPFALSLSGGVDSSTICWAISKRRAAGNHRAALGRPFSQTYPGTDIDESDQIVRILQATDTRDHTLIDMTSDDPVANLTRNAYRADSPCHIALSRLPEFVQAIAQDGRQLILDGSGGDNLFSGSGDYLADLVKDHRLGLFIRDLVTLAPTPNRNRAKVFLKSITPLRILSLIRSLRHQRSSQFPGWIHPSRMSRIGPKQEIRNRATEPEWRYSHQRQILEILAVFQCFAARDGAEMLAASEGVESGSPLLDLDLLDFAFRTPPRAFSDGRGHKHLLRGVAYDGMGDAIKSWQNPYPAFSLRPREIDLLKEALPPESWVLVQEEIVSLPGIDSMFEQAKSVGGPSGPLGSLIVTEAVVRILVSS